MLFFVTHTDAWRGVSIYIIHFLLCDHFHLSMHVFFYYHLPVGLYVFTLAMRVRSFGMSNNKMSVLVKRKGWGDSCIVSL
jgi:hypothetical protein